MAAEYLLLSWQRSASRTRAATWGGGRGKRGKEGEREGGREGGREGERERERERKRESYYFRTS